MTPLTPEELAERAAALPEEDTPLAVLAAFVDSFERCDICRAAPVERALWADIGPHLEVTDLCESHRCLRKAVVRAKRRLREDLDTLELSIHDGEPLWDVVRRARALLKERP